MKIPAFPLSHTFSLTEGGPTYQFMLWIAARKHRAPLLIRRAWIFALITWFPLLVLSALQGLALSKTVTVPFLYDFAAYSRFLLAVPLLVVAEIVTGPALAVTVTAFIDSGLVPERQYPDFEAAIDEGIRLRNSTLVEVIILSLAYVATFLGIKEFGHGVSTWHSVVSDSGRQFTLAGWWYILVCVPITQFLIYRWSFRLLLWGRFLRRVSKLDLQLIPTHPDEAGGLGFLGYAHLPFGMIVFALGVILSGILATRIVFDGASLYDFKFLIATFIVLSLVILMGPLFVFSGKLMQAKRTGILEYTALATNYTLLFHQKWVQGGAPGEESILGSGDIQSLADIGASYERVEQMKLIPFDPKTLLVIALAGLVPLLPLLLTVMPFKDILKGLLNIFV